jgi:hypothetical protein
MGDVARATPEDAGSYLRVAWKAPKGPGPFGPEGRGGISSAETFTKLNASKARQKMDGLIMSQWDWELFIGV